MNTLQFAFRNVLRNTRRSMITLAAIALGFLAINLFGGYAVYSFRGLKRAAIYGEGLGHLTIYKQGFLTDGKFDPSAYMITAEEQQRIGELLSTQPAIQEIMPKLDISGLISNGITTTIFIAQAMRSGDAALLNTDMPFEGEGTRINNDAPIGVQIGSELANMMKLQLNDTAVVMGTTLTGQMNALDVDIVGIYNTGSSATNDKFLMMPLELAQMLYDTTSVDRIVLLLNDTAATERIRQWLLERLPTIGFEAEVKTWNELSVFYTSVQALYSMIFLFIFCIVLVIVVTSVMNTMTMTVVERTQEIGTLRAMGLKRRSTVRLFGAEGMVIGSLGVVAGIIGTLLMIWLITVAHVTYSPPSISREVLLGVAVAPAIMGGSALFLIFLSFLAAVLPSRSASRLKIVDAFGHV